ncbi:tetratricopeptide repeat protein [uncultured Bacteroides sp.]|uniref:tetratricopeptide repeat protein n=1 Tax=uncultured Bacteroides sp. TaxID=162156 RepID=UPI002AAC1667|nr:tetratricopeptide repeat protein [uncultured Bacteroides sp.]
MSNYSSSDFEQDKEFKQALAQYEEMKAAKRTGYFDADQLADFAEYYASLQQYDEAFEVIDYALSIHPANTEVLVIKAHILIDLEKIEEAKEIALSISESYDRDVKMLKAELLIMEKKLEEADTLIQEMVSQDENNEEDNWLDIAFLYTDSDLPEKALPWFEKAFEADPENDEIRMNLAECYGQSKQIDKGADLYNKLLDKDPYSVQYWFDLGRFYYVAKEFNKALEAYEFALTIEADHPGSILMTAHCYYQLENYEKSCEFYERYEETEPKSGMTVFFIGLCHYSLKNYEKCILKFKEALGINQGLSPDTIDIYTYIALSYSELKLLEEAIHYIDLAINEDASCADSYLNKGKIYLGFEDRKNASISFGEAIKLNPENPKTFSEMGTIYFENKMYDRALKCFETVEFYSPGYDNNYLLLAYANGALGNIEDFNYYFIQATKQNPENILQSLDYLPEEETELKQLIIDLRKAIEEDENLNTRKSKFN